MTDVNEHSPATHGYAVGELKDAALHLLRMTAEDDPEMAIMSVANISDDLQCKPDELYDHQMDGGVLFELMQNGKVHRYGDFDTEKAEHDRWCFVAAGGRTVWD